MLKRFLADLRKYNYFCWYSAKTDLKAEVANSYLNWVWWILEPLCIMLVYTFVFGPVFGSNQQYYPVFIYSGLLMWNFFSRTVTYSIKCVRMNRDIVTKVYVPKFTLLISNMLLNGIKLAIALCILAAMMLVFQVPLTPMIFVAIFVYLIMFIFAFGCSTILLHFGVFIDDLGYAIAILINMMFFMSGVFNDIATTVAAPFGQILANLNPMAFFISCMRGALLYGIMPDLRVLLDWAIISIALCVVGVRTIYKYENSYVKVV